MFRYIAFSWNPDDPAQTAAANRLTHALSRPGTWRAELRTAGLAVYCIGGRHGVNRAYLLPSNKGVILGRLFRRHHLASSSSSAIDLTEYEGARVVQSEGRSLIDEFWGRYIAFLPAKKAQGWVLRDPIGALPCYRTRIDGVTVVFSWFEDLFSYLPGMPAPHVKWEAVAAHMFLGSLSGRETALEEVFQVLPGELTPLGDQSRQPLTLWSAVDKARHPEEQSPAAAARHLRETVMTCAQRWASCYDSILLRLSGGVDSTILLSSICAAYPATRVTCLNYHTPGSDSDERGFARLAATRVGALLVEREHDVGYRLDQVLEVARMPMPTSYVGRMGTGRMDVEVAAAHGAQAMFTGAGGDQVFFEIPCTWPAADFLKLHGAGRGFYSAALDSARLGRVSVWQAMRQAVRDQSFVPDFTHGVGEYLALIGNEVAADVAAQSHRFVHPELLNAADLPIGKFNQTRWLSHPIDYQDPYLREMAPEMVNPLLSQPVVELCLATPTFLLTHGGYGRALARRAFAEDIPHEISVRRSKGGIDGHATAIFTRNLDAARALLLDGQLVRQGLLDRERVEAALTGRPSTKDAYIGEIHNCIAIEAWLQRYIGVSSQPMDQASFADLLA